MDASASTTGAAAPTLHLALVDDNDEFRTIVRTVAEALGWAVREFRTGRGLLAAIGVDLRPDLIVLDMVMPDMDGVETIDALKATSVRCPVILVTGRLPLYTETAALLGRAHGLEIAAMLQKPVPIQDLRAALDPARVPSPS